MSPSRESLIWSDGFATLRSPRPFRTSHPFGYLTHQMPADFTIPEFLAENNSLGKEVIRMKYSKPEISELPNAVTAIEAGESLAKQTSATDGIDPQKMTVAAYPADE